MAAFKTIICLANSRKHREACIAGLELTDRGVGKWIRPVSTRAGHGISESEQTLTDGTLPQVLDVVTIGLLEPAPADFQSENWLLDPGHQWSRVGSWTYADTAAVADTPPSLWSNNSSSSGGLHDRVSADELEAIDDSIMLVAVRDATVVVSTSPWGKKVRLSFEYRRTWYELKITDPNYEARYMQAEAGRYALSPQTLVTVSLAEPWTPEGETEAYSYKVVAAIIEPEN